MQCKDVEYTDRKTGKKRKRSGSSAIREGCPPIKPDTRIEDFDLFVKWLADKGISVISIDLHHDEGHADPLTDDLLPNHHAHIIVDWMNHETGKSVKLDANDCKEMQTVLAESLGMERGTPKEDSGIESAIEYKERKARENNQRLTLFGKGKYAEIEKENARLTAENKDMQFAVAKLEAQVVNIPMMVQRQMRQTIEDKAEEHLTEIRELNASHSRELSSLQVRLQNRSARYRELESNNRHIIDNLKREKDTLLAQMEAMSRLLGEKLEKAVRALIQFAKVLAYKTFTREHKEAIVSWLALDWDDPKSTAHFVKVFT